MYRTSVPATAAAFFDRRTELARLDAVLGRVAEGTPEWLAIIGPRKIGKTSLVLEWERRLGDPRLACVVVDAMDGTPSREFFRTLALRVVDRLLGGEAGADLVELAAHPADYRAALVGAPSFAALPAGLRAQLLELPERSLEGTGLAACLELPETLARALGRRLVVAIDEFQELAALEGGKPRLEPFALMRSVWQRHRQVAYAISGSARGMLTELVTSERSPFFQHFTLMELGALEPADAIALLVENAPPGRKIGAALAARAVELLGGQPFYLQLLGETLTALTPPLDEDALKEAIGQLLFTRTGRLALYFENEYHRAVGRASSLAAVLAALAEGPRRPAELGRAIGAASGAVLSYLDRLGDVVARGEDEHWRLVDPVFALWLRWRSPGGAAVPMTVVGDEAERAVAEALARMGFDLVYQSRASRGAFDLLATRGAHQLGVQVKRRAAPARLATAEWKRMHAEGERLGWRWVVAHVTPEGELGFLDPAKLRAGRGGVLLRPEAKLENLLLWVDRPPGKPRKAGPARKPRAR